MKDLSDRSPHYEFWYCYGHKRGRAGLPSHQLPGDRVLAQAYRDGYAAALSAVATEEGTR